MYKVSSNHGFTSNNSRNVFAQKLNIKAFKTFHLIRFFCLCLHGKICKIRRIDLFV